MTTRNKVLVDSFVQSMTESIRLYSNGKLSESEIKFLAEYEVNRLDFENEWQMHKGLGYFAKKAVESYLQKQSAWYTSYPISKNLRKVPEIFYIYA